MSSNSDYVPLRTARKGKTVPPDWWRPGPRWRARGVCVGEGFGGAWPPLPGPLPEGRGKQQSEWLVALTRLLGASAKLSE